MNIKPGIEVLLKCKTVNNHPTDAKVSQEPGEDYAGFEDLLTVGSYYEATVNRDGGYLVYCNYGKRRHMGHQHFEVVSIS